MNNNTASVTAPMTTLTRRDFIKAASAAGGAAVLSSGFSDDAALAASPDNTALDPLLGGVSDIHVHAYPDSKARSINELSFARDAHKAGYRSIMFKSNDFSCHDRAYLVRRALPGFECFGSLCMNRVHGDRVNAYAAEKAVQTTGNVCRCIWMPTMDAAYHVASDKRPGKGIPVLGHTGEVLPEVVKVMEICAEADIIFATGHCSPEESLVLAKKAREVGVGKFVVTHANSSIWKMSAGQIGQSIDLGAFIEYCYLTNLWGPGTAIPVFERMSDKEFADYARIAPERSFITTDLGQLNMPHPVEGMRACLKALLSAGLPQKDVDLLVRRNPARLMGLEA